MVFREYKCGCIVSEYCGRVRICDKHRPASATGDGGMDTSPPRGKTKLYPAFGEAVSNWSGR